MQAAGVIPVPANCFLRNRYFVNLMGLMPTQDLTISNYLVTAGIAHKNVIVTDSENLS